MRKLILINIVLFFIAQGAKAQFSGLQDSVVQLYGIVMTADSLQGIPGVTITIRGQDRGTITKYDGVFSIVALKGDIINFTHVSFKPKQIKIPQNLDGKYYNIVQLMVEDTLFLPATIIHPRPTADQFARDFVNADVPDDKIEIARKNSSIATTRIALNNTAPDGKEANNQQFRQMADKARYYGQAPPMNIFNPAAWVSFIQAWKRGDFKKKN